MAPEVEPLRPIERLRETVCFTVDISRQEVELDIASFDEQLKKVAGGGFEGRAKFIVANNKLLVFPSHHEHAMVYDYAKRAFSREPGDEAPLQSAGFIQFKFSEYEDTRPTRLVYGYSSSLVDYGLEKEDSEKYKQTVLKEALGDRFFVAS